MSRPRALPHVLGLPGPEHHGAVVKVEREQSWASKTALILLEHWWRSIFNLSSPCIHAF